ATSTSSSTCTACVRKRPCMKANRALILSHIAAAVVLAGCARLSGLDDLHSQSDAAPGPVLTVGNTSDTSDASHPAASESDAPDAVVRDASSPSAAVNDATDADTLASDTDEGVTPTNTLTGVHELDAADTVDAVDAASDPSNEALSETEETSPSRPPPSAPLDQDAVAPTNATTIADNIETDAGTGNAPPLTTSDSSGTNAAGDTETFDNASVDDTH